MSISRHACIVLLALLAVPALAQPVQGAITSNTTWSGTVTMTGDVRVDPGVTLTIAASTTVTAVATDAANLGSDAARVELLVQGTRARSGRRPHRPRPPLGV